MHVAHDLTFFARQYGLRPLNLARVHARRPSVADLSDTRFRNVHLMTYSQAHTNPRAQEIPRMSKLAECPEKTADSQLSAS